MAASHPHRYVALGDSMSIDDYTQVEGGGAVHQLFASLPEDAWTLIDRTADGCTMPLVPLEHTGDLITITIGGNDLLSDVDRYLEEGLADFAVAHRRLLEAIRERNRDALFIVGNIYPPQSPLNAIMRERLDEANTIISDNAAAVYAELANIHDAFLGREDELLCLEIEPNLAGATRIAELFREIVARHGLLA